MISRQSGNLLTKLLCFLIQAPRHEHLASLNPYLESRPFWQLVSHENRGGYCHADGGNSVSCLDAAGWGPCRGRWRGAVFDRSRFSDLSPVIFLPLYLPLRSQ